MAGGKGRKRDSKRGPAEDSKVPAGAVGQR